MPFSIFHGYELYEEPCANLTGNSDQDDETLALIMSKFMVRAFNDTYDAEKHLRAAV